MKSRANSRLRFGRRTRRNRWSCRTTQNIRKDRCAIRLPSLSNCYSVVRINRSLTSLGLVTAVTATPTINSPTVSKTTRPWQRAISSITGGALFGFLALLVGAPFGYYCILISLALLFVGSCLLGYWLGLSALIAVLSAGLVTPVLFTQSILAPPSPHNLIAALSYAGIHLFVCLLGWYIGFLLGRCIKKRLSCN